MDVAQIKMMEAMAKLKPINDAIDRGNSVVGKFYSGSTVFVTGGSGFIGKQLIEKLFRSSNIKKLFVLCRQKKGKSVNERIQCMLKEPVFEPLLEKQPNFAERVVAVEGDITSIRLGLSDHDWTMLTEEVDIIFHVAATISFDEPLRVATLTNVRGTREAIALGRQCSNLKSFIHVSTAFCHATEARIGTEVLEQFYPCPIPPDVMIRLAEEVEESRLDNMTPALIKGWPNTYTFTKALAEELVNVTAKDLPICVVRPPIVLSGYHEPAPGWLDPSIIIGPIGVFLAIGLGVHHIFQGSLNTKLALVPVDLVNNGIIAAGWDALERRKYKKDIPVYTVAHKDHPLDWRKGTTFMETKGRKFASPKAVWYTSQICCSNKYLFTVLSFFLHYVPAYILDFICNITGKRPQGIKSFVAIYKKIDKLGLIFSYFTENEWGFKDDNIRNMMTRMTEDDKVIYNCDVSTINFEEYYIKLILGLRKYIVKDGLKDSDLAYKRQLYFFRPLNYIVCALYIYVIFYVLFSGISILRNLFVFLYGLSLN